ncbi:hypothetical protein B0H10DRAFT_1943078, partial [Mycena sp. CBHHK59/15]
MPDPISLVGLVGSVLQLIDMIVKPKDYCSVSTKGSRGVTRHLNCSLGLCHPSPEPLVETLQYAEGLRDAPKDQKRYFAEMASLPPLLLELEVRMRADKSVGIVNGMQQFEKPLVQLEEIVSEMQKKLGPKIVSRKFLDRVKWPLWGEKEVQKGLNALERFKTSLSMWLGGTEEKPY